MNYTKTFLDKYKFEILSFAFIFILIFAVYFHCSNFDFIHLDDTVLIQNKVQDMESISSVKNLIFSSVFDGMRDKFYRPVLTITFLADTLICGGEPGFYHYSNVLWHTFTAFLVFMLFITMKYSKNTSFAAAAIFAVHPALVSAVAWIPGRNDILLAVFSILSFIFFIRQTENNKFSDIILSVLFFTLALFTKETAVMLPIIYILYTLLYGIKISKKNTLQTVISFSIALFLYAGFRHVVLSEGIQSITLYEMIIKNMPTSFKATFWYFGVAGLTEKILLYPHITNISSVKILYPAAFTALLCVLLRKHCNFKHILFGIAWFIFFLLPTYVMPEKNFYTHRLYLPMLGYFIIIFEILRAFKKKYAVNINVFLIFLALLITAMSLKSYKQTFYYKDRASFWLQAIAENPGSSKINAAISVYYADTGDFDKAEQYALTALKYAENTNIPRILVQSAEIYYRKNDMEKSKEYFRKAVEADKFRESGYLGLSRVYENENNKEMSIKILEDAYEVIPQSKAIKKRLDNLKEGKKEFSYVISFKLK
ncbi:MAG: glycosyltransferase family 39 protein [Endomicrobia bacterium]|nr:glycosyltransferase family 39 protein [Endomicrobiia bacterium]